MRVLSDLQFPGAARADAAEYTIPMQLHLGIVQKLQKEIERLTALIQKDPLTGVYSLTALSENLQQICMSDQQERRRLNQDTWLLLIDLDDFKHINDTPGQGHEAGDRALQKAAKFLESQVRKTDMVARRSGDEFVIVLSGADQKAAAQKVENIIAGFNALSFTWHQKRISIRASVGMCKIDPSLTPQKNLERADRSMYRIKHKKKKEQSGFSNGPKI